jgi:hypothetical protein
MALMVDEDVLDTAPWEQGPTLTPAEDVNGHRDLPIGGHGNSPGTAIGIPQGRPRKFPTDGHGNSPGSAVYALRGTTPFPEIASARRTDSPSVTITWA